MASSFSNLPDWVLLDRYIFRRNDDSFPADNPTVAFSTNSRGDEVRVCFQLQDPPQPSRLYLFWPAGTGLCDRFSVVGAHRDAVLLQMAYPICVPNNEFLYDMYDYFLYRTSGGSPSLIHLPSIDGTIEEFRAMFMKGTFRDTNQRTRRIEGLDIAVLRRGAEDVAVAELQIYRTPEPELHVIFPSTSASSSSKWVVKKPRIIHSPDLDSESLLWWYSDTVFPFGSYLCWVDYCQGAILLCNVFDDDPELHHLPLPVDFSEFDGPDGRRLADVHITVGVNEERGVMKCVRLISDDDLFHREFGPLTNYVSKSWTLEMIGTHKLQWKVDAEVELVDLWKHHGSNTPVHMSLEYPVISLEDPSIVCFAMRLKWKSVHEAGHYFDDAWLVSFDMGSNSVKAYFKYVTKEQEGLSVEESMFAKEKCWYFEPFIPAEFPKFLKMHGTSEKKQFHGSMILDIAFGQHAPKRKYEGYKMVKDAASDKEGCTDDEKPSCGGQGGRSTSARKREIFTAPTHVEVDDPAATGRSVDH